MITLEVVTKAVQQMSSNKAPSKGKISIELIKYAPRQLHQEISNILNEIFEKNVEKFPAKYFMNRTDVKVNNYLSQSQSTYRKNRSTTAKLWAHQWLIARTQV